MNLTKALAPIALAAAFATAPLAASAGLVVQITDGVSSTTISDNGAGDLDNYVGVISYYGSIGTWEVTMAFATGTTDPMTMHLGALVAGNSGDGTVTIRVTNTDLVAGGAPMVFGAGGGGYGAYGSMASWASYVDDSNAAFGQATTVFSSNGYGTDGGSLATSLSGLYSATLSATFDYSGVSNRYPVGSSIDVGMHVPEPASLSLVALGLIGAGAARRRKAAGH